MFEHSRAFSGFSVDELAKAREFYSGTLGLPVEDAGDGLRLQLATGAAVFMDPKDNHVPATYTMLKFPLTTSTRR
jgi:catechol 2,3-dioxygenase-like lactoylglutathione lyase family enzyme